MLKYFTENPELKIYIPEDVPLHKRYTGTQLSRKGYPFPQKWDTSL